MLSYNVIYNFAIDRFNVITRRRLRVDDVHVRLIIIFSK